MDETPAQAQQLALFVNRDFHVPILVALLLGGDEILAPVLDPLDGLADRHGGRRQRGIFHIEGALGPEAAAHIIGDDPHLIVGEIQQVDEGALEAVGALRRGVNGELLGSGIPIGHHAATFQKKGPAAMQGELLAIHMRRVGEGLVGVADLHGHLGDDVACGAALGQRRARDDRLARIDGGGQHLVIDLHQRRRVFRDIAAFGHDDGDGFARETGLVLGERPGHEGLLDGGMGHIERQAARAHGLGQIRMGQHGHDAGQGQRRALVDALDQRMGVGAAHEGGVQHARQLHVIHIAALAGEQGRVFLAQNAGAEKSHSHHACSALLARIFAAASRPASTMA